MTQCIRCHADKPQTDFYDRDRTCKECRKTLVRANRKAKLDYYREYDRNRAFREDRVEARRRYQKMLDPIKKQKGFLRQRKWAERNRTKRAAHVIVGNALRDKRLTKQPCEICGKKAQAHHDDYTKPLDIKWLCPEHHGMRHRELNAVRREI